MPRRGGDEGGYPGGAPPGRRWGGGGPPSNLQAIIHGQVPDYLGLARSSARYQSWAASARQRRTNAAATRREGIRSLLLSYGGGLPSGFSDAYGDVDPALIAAAQNNPNSQTNLMARQFQQRGAAEEDVRTARGIVGEGGQQLVEQRTAANDRSTAEQSMLDALLSALRGSVGNFTDTTGGIDAEESGVLGQSIQEATDANPVPADTTAQYIPGSEDQYGAPVYRDAAGRMYKLDANGNPVPYTPLPQPTVPPGWTQPGQGLPRPRVPPHWRP
jgi:hypothetical protein